ncbi:hypothetical protein KSP39_PZI004329 [Platanthera zijinensis]|uniref:Uncharacterized protein n=1 Tax=Platanthera zijinensis TaxID=2320716 RepID=A0AAP0GCD3_9ASPA
MALWVRTGGLWVTRWSPEILLAPPPVAAEVSRKMWKTRKMNRAWIRAVCCSLEQRDYDTQQQLSLAGEMEMDMEEEKYNTAVCWKYVRPL